MPTALTLLAYLDPGEPDKGLSSIAVAGIAIGAAVLIALIVLAFRFFLRSERAARHDR
jgi:hypothetical protein